MSNCSMKISCCTVVENALLRLIEKHNLNAEDDIIFYRIILRAFFRDKLLAGLKNINFVIPQEKWFTN